MPVKITRLGRSNKYRVSTPNGVHAKGTTLEKAEAQKRLIDAVDHGWKPTGEPAKKTGQKSQKKDTNLRKGGRNR